ncbi:MAG: hypothetical protein GW938_06655 [Leptospira sp.]|nr:hypothetical protein [Leptospira sp.]NCS94097.1 hypothetical protein [Leptospira sp.]
MLAFNFLKFINHNYLVILFIIVSIHCDGDLFYNGRDSKDSSKLSRTEFYGRIDAAILLKAYLCGSKEI